jgi:metal-dependent amidase/aminoacylase/carboxypeptidase family protein
LERSRPTKINVVAWLVGEQPGRMFTIRADMDTLPIQKNDFEFASQNAGAMRACGHGGYITMPRDH